MELLQLQYFRELARNEHLSKTAESLHITQPSLSQMLKRLENEVGVQLFDRVGNRIVLNESGKIFLKHVDDVFVTLNNAMREIDKSEIKKKKTINLYIRSASMYLVDIVKWIQQEEPGIILQVFHQMGSESLEYPALYLSSTAKRPISNKNTKLLMREELKLALPIEHPLASKRSLVWEDLKQEPFLSLDKESDLAKTVKYFCKIRGIEPNITTCVDDPSTMRDFLRLRLGIAFVPEYTWKDFASDTVVLKTVEDIPMERYLLLSWKEDVCKTSEWRICKNIITDYFLMKLSYQNK